MTDAEIATPVTPRRRASFSGWEQLLGLDGTAPPTFDNAIGTDNHAVLYLRVSTPRQMNTAIDIDADGNSIATQRQLCIARAKRSKAPISKEFVEPGNSAQTIAKRPVFREMLRYIEEHPEVSYVIIYTRSRIFRNQTDAAITKRILANMGVKLISAKEDFGDSYMGDAMETILDVFNEMQVRQSGEDIKQKLLHKAQNGGTTGRAKLGYKNVREDFDGRLVNTIGIDEKRAPLIKWAFEQYATGDYSAARLADALAEQGLTTRKSAKWPERPLSRSQLGLILRDPYYIGMVTFKGELYPGRHEPLISPELFARVQQVIDMRVKRGQLDRVHNHFLRGMLHCGRCHDAGQEHRLIYTEAKNHAGDLYDYFLCRGRQDGFCELPYLPTAQIEKAIAAEFRSLRFSPEQLDVARSHVTRALDHLLASRKEQQTRLTKELKKLDVQEERLLDLATDGSLPTDKLRSRLRDLQVKKHRLKATLDTTDEHLHDRTTMVLSYLDLMERPDALFISADGSIKRKLLAAFFQRIWVDDNGHEVTVQHEFQPLVADLRDAVLNTPTNTKSAGDISDASAESSTEQLTHYLKVICSSGTTLVAGAGLEPATSRL